MYFFDYPGCKISYRQGDPADLTDLYLRSAVKIIFSALMSYNASGILIANKNFGSSGSINNIDRNIEVIQTNNAGLYTRLIEIMIQVETRQVSRSRAILD